MQTIFSLLMLLLSFSDQSIHMGCNNHIPQATECWIASPSTGTTTWLTPTAITYTRSR